MDNDKWNLFKSSTSDYYKKNGLKKLKDLIPSTKNINILWDNIKNSLIHARNTKIPFTWINKSSLKETKPE